MTGNSPERRTSEPEDGRRWHIPPPVLGLTGLTGPEGIVILDEVDGELGALLWRTFRSVATWAGAPEAGRTGLFPAPLAAERKAWVRASALPAGLVGPLLDLASLLEDDAQVDAHTAGEAAGAIGRWATAAGHVRTGAEFHQLACSVLPDDPSLALEAARTTRDLADYARAEVWLQHTIGLSRRTGEWRTYIEAHLSYGNMMRRRGNLPLARRLFERALRRARRQGLRGFVASSLHDLFVVEAEYGNLDRAEVLAERAFAAYPEDHPVRPWLVHDLAYIWIRQERFAPALAALRSVERAVPDPGIAVLQGALALAAGGAGDGEQFDEACRRLDGLEAGPNVSEAWMEAAQGAMHLGRLFEARQWAERSLQLARARRERKVEYLVEQMLDSMADARPAEPAGTAAAALPDLAERVVRELRAPGKADALAGRR